MKQKESEKRKQKDREKHTEEEKRKQKERRENRRRERRKQKKRDATTTFDLVAILWAVKLQYGISLCKCIYMEGLSHKCGCELGCTQHCSVKRKV